MWPVLSDFAAGRPFCPCPGPCPGFGLSGSGSRRSDHAEQHRLMNTAITTIPQLRSDASPWAIKHPVAQSDRNSGSSAFPRARAWSTRGQSASFGSPLAIVDVSTLPTKTASPGIAESNPIV